MPDLVSKLRDLDSPESRVVQAVATGAFTALVSPAKMPRRGRTAMHALTGLAGAAAGALALGEKASVPQRAAAATALGATLYGVSALGIAADVKAEEWLRARGVRRPRLWLGVLGAVVAWLTSAPRGSDAQAPDHAAAVGDAAGHAAPHDAPENQPADGPAPLS